MSIECSAKAYDGKEPFLFVSYAHNDAHLVYPIIERLVMDGYRVWYDDGIHAGEDWAESVANRLDDSSICLAMLTENSVASVNCRNEISYSIGGGKTVIGIKLSDFEMPKGMRLQMGSTLYLERYRYGETEFYERLYLSHGMPGCRAESPRITDGQLMAWRARWANTTPVNAAKGDPEPGTAPAVKQTAAAEAQTAAPLREKPKKKVGLLITGLCCLCALVIWLVLRSSSREAPDTAPAVTQTAAAEEQTATPVPEAEAPAEEPGTDAPVDETAEEKEPDEEPEAQADEDEWTVVTPETSGDDVQILSYRYKGGPEVEKIEYYSTGGINGSVEIDVFFRQNKEIAALVAGAYFGGPVSDEDIEMYEPFARKYFKYAEISMKPKNAIAMNYGPISSEDMTSKDNSDFLLWYGFNKTGEIVSLMIVEVGIPLSVF